jgi:hypothetical protein
MSAVNVHYLDGQDLHLTVYHPSLNATQIAHIKAIDAKSTEVATNSWLLALLGFCFAMTSLSQPKESAFAMVIVSFVLMIGGASAYLLETHMLYRRRLGSLADRFGISPGQMRASITVSSDDKRLQRQLFDLAVAVRDKQENKADAAALYAAVLEHRDGAADLYTRPINVLMDAL